MLGREGAEEGREGREGGRGGRDGGREDDITSAESVEGSGEKEHCTLPCLSAVQYISK